MSKLPSLLSTPTTPPNLPVVRSTAPTSMFTPTKSSSDASSSLLHTARNVFDEMKETSGTLKKWNNDQSDLSLNAIASKNGFVDDNDDDYDEEFDKPQNRQPKLKFNSGNKFGNSPYLSTKTTTASNNNNISNNSFHSYTHRMESSNNYNYNNNNNWNSHKKFNNQQ
jgi:hypothetical protein